jgi:hypothetical protein
MIYINIEKNVAITRLQLSPPVLSLQIMFFLFAFPFTLHLSTITNIIIIYVSRNYISICIYLFHMTFLSVLCI